MQASFLSGRRRLTNRRIDWLLWILHSKVAEAYHRRAHDQALGATKNHKAYHSLKRAIERADAQPDSAVTLAGGEAVVKSASSTGVAYSVQLSVDSNRQPQCSCTAGRKGIICWHVVKVLQSLGASNAQLLRYMGTLLGAVGGGFAGLKAAMSRAAQSASGSQPAEENTLELGAGADQSGGPADEIEVVSSPELEISSTSEAAHDQVQSGSSRQKAEAAIAELAAMTRSWPDDSQLWGYMLVAARRARGDVEKSIAGSSLDVHRLDFQPNLNAPAGNSMGRLRTWLEDVAKRKQGKEKRALERSDSDGSQSELSGGSGVQIVHGFVGRSGPKKLKSVHQEIKAKSRLYKSSHHLDTVAADVGDAPPVHADTVAASSQPPGPAPTSARPGREVKKPRRYE